MSLHQNKKIIAEADVDIVQPTSTLLSGKAAARIIGIASQTLAQWRSNRRVEIPFVRVGRRVMYRRSDIDAFIAANTHFATEVSNG